MAYVRDIPRSLRKSYDPLTSAVTVIQEQHRVSHDGFMYHASGRVASLADAASYDLLLNVGIGSIEDDVYPHFQKVVFSVSDGPVDIKAYEATTTTAQGTGITIYNVNRNSINTPGLILTHTPTVTSPGNLIHDRYVPSAGTGIGQSNVGVIASGTQEEWILQPREQYLVRLTNTSGGAVQVGFELMWYELDYED